MPVRAPSKAEILEWSPHARPEYVAALTSNAELLAESGVLDSNLTLSHFMAQVGGETNGLRIKRESMSYSSVARIRQVWPARSRRTRASVLRGLVRNPVGLASWAYNGRMGNRRGTTDGYDYRGGGFLQTTGRWAVRKYAKRLDLDLSPELLDDADATLKFACFEWAEGNCSGYAEENDILSIAKYINTGSATSGIRPNGMNHRKHWLRQAWKVWGEKNREHIPEVSDITVGDLRSKGSKTISNADLIETGAAVGGTVSVAKGVAEKTGSIPVPTPAPDKDPLQGLRDITESTDLLTTAVNSLKGFVELAVSNIWVLGIACGLAGILLARKIKWRRLSDARRGLHIGRLFG